MKPKSIVITTPSTLEPGARTQPVLPRWVLSGAPVTRTWDVLRSHDLTSDIVIWECSAGCFECQYSQDEAVVIVEGEVFITDEKGEERRLGREIWASSPQGPLASGEFRNACGK